MDNIKQWIQITAIAQGVRAAEDRSRWKEIVSQVVVVVRLEHSHSFNDSLDNHSTASGQAWCRRCRPPGNAVSGHSSIVCIVVWWLSPQGQAGDAITPHP